MLTHELSVFLTAVVHRVDGAEIPVVIATNLRVVALVQFSKLRQISGAEALPLPYPRVLLVCYDRCPSVSVSVRRALFSLKRYEIHGSFRCEMCSAEYHMGPLFPCFPL